MKPVRRFGALLLLLANPKQLQHEVGEEETPAGRALSGVAVRFAFHETMARQQIRFRRSGLSEDEDVVELEGQS